MLNNIKFRMSRITRHAKRIGKCIQEKNLLIETNPEIVEIVEFTDEDLRRNYKYIHRFKGKCEPGEAKSNC